MAEINTVIAEASQDLQTIEDFVNLPADSEVYPRLLPSVNVGTLAGARQAIFEAGGLPAKPFATKALMTASALVDGDYAMVTDDATNNGLYVKTAGSWVKSQYDTLNLVKSLATVSPQYLGTPHHLDDLKTVGTYVSALTALVSVENGYPTSAGSYYIEVTSAPSSSVATWQVAYSSSGEIYNRFWGGTKWYDWRKMSPDNGISFSMRGVLNNTQNLNEIFEAGVYLQNISKSAVPELGYPADKEGILSVYTHPSTGIAFQTYTYPEGFWVRLGAKTTGYGNWNLLAGEDAPYKTNQYNSRDIINVDDDINDFKEDGYYIRNNASTGVNFPIDALGVLTVRTHSLTPYVQQEFTQGYGTTWGRFWNGTNWSGWRSGFGLTSPNDALNILGKITQDQDWDEFNQTGVYIKNILLNGPNSAPLNKYGSLTVYVPSSTTFKIQQFISEDGVVAVRTGSTANGWGEWKVNNPSPVSSSSDGSLYFTKTETNLTFENPMPNGKSTKTVFGRTTRGAVNLDNWGINGCTAITPEKSFNLVSSGVWETAIVDSENISDHSGGGHGDEVLSEAYFMVDGVYYPQDFVLEGRADKIEFYQKSTIFVEASSTVICHKVVKWTFTKEKYNLKQWLEFPSERTLGTAWISMLPVLRKSNPDNTGDQITDTEIRSQDMLVVDTSEPDFEVRNLPIGDGDSITLSSAISGVSARLTVNEIQATEEPQAFVENTAVYNKIYISAIPIKVTTTIPANSKWYIDSDFFVKVL